MIRDETPLVSFLGFCRLVLSRPPLCRLSFCPLSRLSRGDTARRPDSGRREERAVPFFWSGGCSYADSQHQGQDLQAEEASAEAPERAAGACSADGGTCVSSPCPPFFSAQVKAKATLGSGNLRQAVILPQGEDRNEWLAVNTVDFFNQINLLYGSITEFCTDQTCPIMSAGPK